MGGLLHLARQRPAIDANTAVLLTAVFITVFGNLSFWGELSTILGRVSVSNLQLLGIVALVQVAVYHTLLSVLCWPGTTRVVLILVLGISAVSAYFIDQMGTYIDADMLRNVLQTDLHESRELLSGSLLAYLAVLGLLPAALLVRLRLRRPPVLRFLLHRLLLCTVLLGLAVGGVMLDNKSIFFVARQNQDLAHRMNPYYPLAQAHKLVRQTLKAQQSLLPPDPRGRQARQFAREGTARPRVLVLVLGETARSANFQLNGYTRQTTPRLAQLPLINFGPTESCGTATARSVPCMFSMLDRAHYSDVQAARHVNLVDVLTTAGVEVLWRDNDGGCKGVCAHATRVMLRNPDDPECGVDGCPDGVMLHELPGMLASVRQDTLIVLHQEGSHGPTYYQRYPDAFRKFTPDCRRADLQACSRDEVVNAYDNTILYTDHVVAEVVQQLRSQAGVLDAAMMYISDHGESLGENGLYLHGMPYALAPIEQKQVPFLLWLSEDWTQAEALDKGCLGRLPSTPASHDQLFSFVLGLFTIDTDAYDPQRDPLAECRRAR